MWGNTVTTVYYPFFFVHITCLHHELPPFILEVVEYIAETVPHFRQVPCRCGHGLIHPIGVRVVVPKGGEERLGILNGGCPRLIEARSLSRRGRMVAEDIPRPVLVYQGEALDGLPLAVLVSLIVVLEIWKDVVVGIIDIEHDMDVVV